MPIADAVREALARHGICPGEHINCSGTLTRCGTVDKPHGTDASYLVHADHPASVTFTNWRTGNSGTVRLSGDVVPPPGQRAAEEIRQGEKQGEARRTEAARKAAAIWDNAPRAPDDHPYLSRKNVPSLGLKSAGNGALIVPAMDMNGNIRSLQFIRDDGGKRFMKDGAPAGCCYPIPARDGDKDGPLLIAEGYATAATLHHVTGHAVLTAFNCGNLLPVARAARALYPNREILICGDNDVETEGNPGLEHAARAAEAIGARLVIPPAHEGRSTDFNDLAAWRSSEAVRECFSPAGNAGPALGPAADRHSVVSGLRVLNIVEALSLEVPPRGHVLYPVIPEQGLCMLYAERGIGKTHAALHMAYAVASGGSVFTWKAPSPSQVLYIDGEMPFSSLQSRLAGIVAGMDSEPPDPGFLRILTPDLQGDMLMPNLATEAGQTAIEPFLAGVKLVVVDNLATLARTGRANDEEGWAPVQTWILRLRRRGISVLLVHHAGKGGSQRGTSAKEDVLDTVIRLRRPPDYCAEQGARFEVHLTKGRGVFGQEAEPFEATLQEENGISTWNVRALEDLRADRLRELVEAGTPSREIAEELEMSKSAVLRLCKKLGVRLEKRNQWTPK